jgi:hypothetical protein
MNSSEIKKEEKQLHMYVNGRSLEDMTEQTDTLQIYNISTFPVISKVVPVLN